MLTFHFHDLICVLNHLVFGFIAEGVSPGLNQVQNLVSDIWFCLLLKVTVKHKRTQNTQPFNPTCFFYMFTTTSKNRRSEVGSPFCLYQVKTLLSQDNDIIRKLQTTWTAEPVSHGTSRIQSNINTSYCLDQSAARERGAVTESEIKRVRS